MAARLKPRHQEDVKAKIQTSQLVNRLTDHANGKVKLTTTQVQAIKILLDKTLSDAPRQVELDADVRTADVSGEPLSPDEWEKQYGNSLASSAGATESVN